MRGRSGIPTRGFGSLFEEMTLACAWVAQEYNVGTVSEF